jgi:inactivated superfamily I helicase
MDLLHFSLQEIGMKKFVLILTGIGITLLCSTGIALAGDEAIQTMARITMSLNHYPSDDDKVALKGILDNDDNSEEATDIAMALSNFEHKILEKDTDRLSDIISDDSTDAGARKLATILLRVNHSPSDEDKTELSALAEE